MYQDYFFGYIDPFSIKITQMQFLTFLLGICYVKYLTKELCIIYMLNSEQLWLGAKNKYILW